MSTQALLCSADQWLLAWKGKIEIAEAYCLNDMARLRIVSTKTQFFSPRFSSCSLPIKYSSFQIHLISPIDHPQHLGGFAGASSLLWGKH